MNRFSFLTTLSLILFIFSNTVKAQDLVVIPSTNLHLDDSVYVFVPSSYSADNTCPVLYLLHGYSGNYKDWSRHMDLQALADQYNYLIVCPDGFANGWYVNNSNPRGMQWRSFFDRELYPKIQELYRSKPEECFITGLSMGGHGAINIFIDNMDRFRAAGTMSGVLDLHHTPLKEDMIPDVLGEYSPSNARYYTESAMNRLELIAGSDKPILISCGYEDTYAFSSELFAERCKELNIPYFLMMSPGIHSWDFWTYAVKKQLDIFTQLLNGENMGF